MPRWHTTDRGSQEVLATALPQMALDQPLNALSAMQLSSRLLGARQTEREGAAGAESRGATLAAGRAREKRLRLE